MKTVNIDLGERGYAIPIGPGVLSSLPELLVKHEIQEELYIITDTNVHQYYHQTIKDLFNKTDINPVIFTVPAGEKSKSLDVANQLYTQLLENNATRKAAIVAFGGGVVGDLAGFIAATFMRGVPFVQVPTTILSQVDSSVGGKVGINHPLGKNLIGAFYQPEFVLIDPDVLVTLPEREIKAGIAEVIKYSFIWDYDFFTSLFDHIDSLISLSDTKYLVDVLAKCCEIKANVVEQDEKESGLRSILNFGHTAGHALEAVTGYNHFLHGEAVSHGMRAAIHLSMLENRIDNKTAQNALKLVDLLTPPEIPSFVTVDDILQATQKDKKRSKAGQLWILLDGIGKYAMTRDVSNDHIKSAVEFMIRYAL